MEKNIWKWDKCILKGSSKFSKIRIGKLKKDKKGS